MTTGGNNLVRGALVQWTMGNGYGVVVAMDERMITVRWDAEGIPTQFAAADPPLSRVDLMGKPVCRRSTGEDVAVLNPVAGAMPVWHCRIYPKSGSPMMSNVAEEDLRPLPITDPIERFRTGDIGSMKKYRLQEVTRWYRVQHLHDDLVSLGQVQVDIKPHQVSVVHKVISDYPHRFLLCDEVGLGKTIEAGMALKELRARGGAQRVLAIVPPNLVRQWQFEMKTKFNESFSVLNTNTVRYLANEGFGGNPFTYSDSVLCSANWVANPQRAKECAAVDWDFIIVDEAHHARSHPDGSTTRLYELVRDLAPSQHINRRGMLLLTATPMQMNTHELYSLVELLNPTLFPSPEEFERHRRRVPGLSKLVEGLYQHGFPLPDQDPSDTAQHVAEWLDLGLEAARQRLADCTHNREALDTLAQELGDKHRLTEVLIRNRKSVVGGFMPRRAYRWPVDLTAKERAALQAVEAYVQYGFQMAEGGNDNAIGFVMTTFQKLMGSSIAAVRESLGRRRERVQEQNATRQSAEELEDRFDNDDNASDVVGTNTLVDLELNWLDQAINALDDVEGDSKATVLVDRLATIFQDTPDEKIIIFTQFRETQRHLEERLSARGWGVNLFHGQLSTQGKDAAVAQFRDASGPQVLISTEAGGEGRNLQFAHLLVNYDLPWNPMKVEQRIGRIDRIGQDHPISIFNLWVNDTVEARVLEVLEQRIRVFEETVGGLDPILGDTENDIRRIMRTVSADRDAALDELGRRVEEEMRNAREAGELLGDFIMDTKSYRKEIAERLAGQQSPIDSADFERYIGQLLADVRTYIRRDGDVYDLTFRSEFCDSPDIRHLFPAGPKMRAVFRPDSRPDAEDVEFMAFGHKVVDAIVDIVLSEGYEGVTGTRRIPAGGGLTPTTGWLFTYQFTVSGVRPVEHVVPVFVSDAGEVDVAAGHRLLQNAFSFDDDETEIGWEDIPDNLTDAEALAKEFAGTESEKIRTEAQADAMVRTDREMSRIEALFDYKERGAADKVEATRQTLNRIRESTEESQRQILPVWEANLRTAEELSTNLASERQRRIAEVERFRYPQLDWILKSVGRIEVVEFGP